MKILYIYQHFVTPEKNGITRTYEQAKRLCAAGHEVHLIASDETFSEFKRDPYRTEHSGIKIHWLPIPYHNRLSFFRRIIAFSKFALGAARLGRRLDYEVVYVSSPPLTATLPGVYLARHKKVPLVLEVRDLWPDLPVVFRALRNPISIWLARRLELFAYKNARRVIALSPGIRKAVIERGVPAEHTFLVPNSCDIENFSNNKTPGLELPSGIGQDDAIVLYPGTVGIANGISYLVHLAHNMKRLNPSVKFLVVGDGKEKDHVLELSRQLEVLNVNFFLKDPIPKVQIPSLFNRATIIINTLIDHPALWNSSPNKFFDALAAGKPIVINFEGWLADLIRKHDIGIVIHPNDTALAAQQIHNCLNRKAWLELSGKNAHRLGKEGFHRDKLFDTLHEALLEVCPRTRAESLKEKKRAS